MCTAMRLLTVHSILQLSSAPIEDVGARVMPETCVCALFFHHQPHSHVLQNHTKLVICMIACAHPHTRAHADRYGKISRATIIHNQEFPAAGILQTLLNMDFTQSKIGWLQRNRKFTCIMVHLLHRMRPMSFMYNDQCILECKCVYMCLNTCMHENTHTRMDSH